MTKTGGAARLAPLLAALATTWAFLRLHAVIAAPEAPPLALLRGPPHPLPPRYGWWAWADQGWYDKSALAWAHGITDWWMHWYLPGYPLLGAIFVRVTPLDPFLIPNLASMLGTLVLFCALARHLLGPSPLGIPLCAAIFVATAVLPHQVLTAWVTPWTTTPETFCVYAALLAGAAMIERPRPGAAFLVGLAGGAIAGFRPADCAVVLLVATAAILPPLLSRGFGRRSLLWPMEAGVALPMLVFGAAYLAVWGPHASGYVTTSGRLGFEPRLLLLRWVNLMVDPGALYPEGQGLAAVFFWIPAGVAGMAATLAQGRAGRAHLLVIGVVAADIALFLIYRDLHPTGLWRFELYHYFTWSLPIFGLYAWRLVAIAVRRSAGRPRALLAAALVTPLLFWCHERLVPVAALAPVRDAVLAIPHGLAPIDMAVIVPGHGPGNVPVVDATAITADGRVFHSGFDFVVYEGGGELRILPLRPLPAIATRIRLNDGTFDANGAAPELTKQRIGWRWGFPPARARSP